MNRNGKYNARRVTYDYITFDSKREGSRYLVLRSMRDCGEICELKIQPPFPLVVNGQKVGTYYADFEYVTCDGRKIYEDVKGVRTPIFSLKKKLVKAIYGIEIQEIK